VSADEVDVQDMGDTSIPDDVRDKLLNFVRAGLAAAYIKGKSYVSFGSVSMGIAGSITVDEFFQKYLGTFLKTYINDTTKN